MLLPDLQQTDLALPTLVQLLLHPLFGGILVAAVLGATMSTIDSVLLLASSLVVENLYVPLSRREVSQERGVRLARWTTLGIGALALTVAVDPPATILFIVTMSFSLLASAFTFPLLLGMWWPRATRAGGLVAMVGGAAFCVLWYVLGYLEHGSFDNWIAGLWPALIGPLVSLVLLVVVSLVTAPPPREVHEVFFAEGE